MGLRILKNANSSQWSKAKLLYSMCGKNDICPQAHFSSPPNGKQAYVPL